MGWDGRGSWEKELRKIEVKNLVFSAGTAVGWGALWGDGRKLEGGGGVSEPKRVTWAFVGRWWQAPPWPLPLNAKQQSFCLASAAVDACAEGFSDNQEPTQSVHTYTHTPHNPPRRSKPQCIQDLHIHSPSRNSYTAGALSSRSVTHPHTSALRGQERARGQLSSNTQRTQFPRHK